jgi:hypothetical protein
MKKIIATLIAAVALPFAVSAHEHQIFEINGIKYEFGIGSMNEPVVVDDKSGLELRVSKVGVVPGHEDHHASGAEGAVAGLEKTLKVELVADGARKTLELEPAWGVAGLYNAPFYPTEATQFSYRLFGTMEGIPVDLTFTCMPRHDMEGATTDTTRTEVSPGVVRVEKRGAFGCPQEKAELGFPSLAVSEKGLVDSARIATFVAFGSLAVSIGALAVAWRRRS